MRRALLYLSLLWTSLCGAAPTQSDPESWLMIDTVSRTLEVVQGDQVKQIFHNISVGRNGYSFDHHEGDGRTPLGVFHVAWINPNSRFHLFFGLDYPNQNYAEEAFRRKLIDFDTYFAIRKALHRGELPPQDTPLGGHIGIHGLGHGSRFIHETTNWTQGCVALTNEQIDQLAQWVTLGTKVVIY
jgi:murein L,D-transpeptidase YafK